MKLQQLRYAVEVGRRDLNISDAAIALHTSQPGISKQIRLLEDELGTDIFVRQGRRIVEVTPPGRAILAAAEQVLAKVGDIKKMGADFSETERGLLRIGASPDVCRSVLPDAVRRFQSAYPLIGVEILCADPTLLDTLAADGSVDLTLGGATEEISGLGKISCLKTRPCLIVSQKHFHVPPSQDECRLLPWVAVCSVDNPLHDTPPTASCADMSFALEWIDRQPACAWVDGAALTGDEAVFEISISSAPTWICLALRQGHYLRKYAFDFLRFIDENLNEDVVRRALEGGYEDFSI